MNWKRRFFLGTASILLLAGMTCASGQGSSGMKIGVIGSGLVGGTIGRHWHKAGHEVMFSARSLEDVQPIAKELGARAHAGTPREAAAFGDVVFLAVPYGAMPQVARDVAAELKGKVVLDAGNPVPGRDGDMAIAARAKGAGLATAEFLPGARVVRAFNSMSWTVFSNQAHRAPERVAIPIAGDDAEALKLASRLVLDAGFDPVIVGPLARGRDFDMGSKGMGLVMGARELRRAMGLPD